MKMTDKAAIANEDGSISIRTLTDNVAFIRF